PVASGQAAGAARADRAPDRASTPAVAAKALNGVGLSRCWMASPIAPARPKAISSRAAGQAARPSDCMNTSANSAPFSPSQLVGAAEEAALRLGSAGFHEIRAASSRAASRACSTPRKRTTNGAAHRMQALSKARWPRARAADIRRRTPAKRDLDRCRPDRVKGLFTWPLAAFHFAALDLVAARRDNRAMTETDRYDVIIAGAGLAGATFALAAAQGGLKVV